MKKIYKVPFVKSIDVDTNDIIALSGDITTIQPDEGPEEDVKEENSATKRNLWGNEW